MATPPPFTLEPLVLWIPAFSIILGTCLFVAAVRRPLGAVRWLLAALVLSSPLTLPARTQYAPMNWAVLDTLATTMAIISAARLPSLDHVVRAHERSRLSLFVWMILPMARFLPSDLHARRENRSRAPRFFLAALAKVSAWYALLFLATKLAGDQVPWPLHSALLMFYFVLNLTATADALSGLCLLFGCDIDVLFDAPLLSTSPRDFWSRRWNKFINRFALKHVALPLRRRLPQVGVILGVFVSSGAFHEYFAWGVAHHEKNPGWMTLFFAIQGGIVWLGSRMAPPPFPSVIRRVLTFAWMMVTAPIFFKPVKTMLLAFGYPVDWFPCLPFLP